MHTGRRTTMLRILFLAGLTSLSLAVLASAAQAGGRSGKEPELERPSRRPIASVKKKVSRVVTPRARNSKSNSNRSAQAVLANQGLLRQSWTIADLNPMPALLDLDDTLRNLRRATEEISRLMRR
jgi:hypothetical protein